MIMENEISKLYCLFKKYKLARNFASRCSLFGKRQEVAGYLEKNALLYLELEPLAFYCCKAVYTMGSIDDLKHFLPRIIELMVTDPNWFSHPTDLFKKLKENGFEKWDVAEQKLIYEICEKFFITYLNGQANGMLSTILEDFDELFNLESFYEMWLSHANENAISHFIVEAKYQNVPIDFYWKYIEKIEVMYLEATDIELKSKLEDFLDQHEKYLKDWY